MVSHAFWGSNVLTGALLMSGLLLLVLLVLAFAHRLSASRIRFRASATKWLSVEIELDRSPESPPAISRSD